MKLCPVLSSCAKDPMRPRLFQHGYLREESLTMLKQVEKILSDFLLSVFKPNVNVNDASIQ